MAVLDSGTDTTMVAIIDVRDANVKLVNSQPLIAVFVGGTSGIGDYTVRELVKAHTNNGDGLRIYLIGRKPEAAEAIFADCRRTHDKGEYHFVKAADLSLLRNVDEAAAEVMKHLQDTPAADGEPRIDLLCMSQGGLYLNGRQGA